MSIKIGSIVVTVNEFKEEKATWKLSYPNIGEKLTVSKITPHPNKDLRKKNISLLNFEEYPNMIGLCDKRENNELNFMQLPIKREEKKKTNKTKIKHVF